MTTPDAHGNYDLGKNFCYHRVVDENDVVDYQGPNEKIINKHFLKPAAPIFAGGLPSNKMVITGIACGGHHMLVTAQGPGESASKLYSCGLNNYGQLGLGDVNDASSEVSADRHELTLVSINVVVCLVYAMSRDTHLKCSLSNACVVSLSITMQVKALEHENIVKVAAGEHFSMALNSDGTVLYSFGRADYGSLGIDTRKPGEKSIPTGSSILVPTPVKFPGTERVILSDIACGDRHSLALTTENELYTCGFGTTGITGHKTADDEDIFVPTKLDLKKHLGQNTLSFQISGGGQHTLVVSKRYK
jgi:regulator of chromosome condensation